MAEDKMELLKKLFQHTLSDDSMIRAAAYRALSNFQPEDSIISCLLNGMEDPSATARHAAGASLIHLGCLNQKTPVR